MHGYLSDQRRDPKQISQQMTQRARSKRGGQGNTADQLYTLGKEQARRERDTFFSFLSLGEPPSTRRDDCFVFGSDGGEC